MTRETLDKAEREVQLHLSLHRPIDLTWWDWTGLMQVRMHSLGACYGERPPVELVRAYAADAMAHLAAVIEAEEADPMAEAA